MNSTLCSNHDEKSFLAASLASLLAAFNAIRRSARTMDHDCCTATSVSTHFCASLRAAIHVKSEQGLFLSRKAGEESLPACSVLLDRSPCQSPGLAGDPVLPGSSLPRRAALVQDRSRRFPHGVCRGLCTPLGWQREKGVPCSWDPFLRLSAPQEVPAAPSSAAEGRQRSPCAS